MLNKSQTLYQDPLNHDSLEETYSGLARCTEEVAMNLLPKNKKKKGKYVFDNQSVTDARQHLSSIYFSFAYHKDPTPTIKLSE